MKTLAATGLCFAIAACSSSGAPQVVRGRVDSATFPRAVDQVVAIANGKTIASAALGAQGEFSLALPANASYRIELTSAASRVGLVQPRASGTIDVSFAVKGSAAPFDMGMVRWVGAATSTTYHQTSTSDGDGECENGVDAATGQPCVDDNSAACEANDGETNDGETNDDGEARDGDGETNDDGEASDGDGETDDDAPGDSAIAEHNLPSAIGCEDGAD